jgi:hypothetical protein
MEYYVTFHVVGTFSTIVKAENEAEARKKAEKLAESEDFGTFIDEVTVCDVDSVAILHTVRETHA